MKRPRVSYFEMRGRAEAIRLMLHANDVSFEDRRVRVASEWAELRAALPLGRLPYFESDTAICWLSILALAPWQE